MVTHEPEPHQQIKRINVAVADSSSTVRRYTAPSQRAVITAGDQVRTVRWRRGDPVAYVLDGRK